MSRLKNFELGNLFVNSHDAIIDERLVGVDTIVSAALIGNVLFIKEQGDDITTIFGQNDGSDILSVLELVREGVVGESVHAGVNERQMLF